MSLHSTAEIIHKIIKIIIIIGIIFFLGMMLIRLGNVVKKVLFPPPPDLPNSKFGKLDQIPFPDSQILDTFTYSIETLTGDLTLANKKRAPDRIKVYKIDQPAVSLLNVQKTREMVGNIGFTDDSDNNYRETQLTPSTYQWELTFDGLFRKITVDTNTYNFQYTSAYRTSPGFLDQSYTGSGENAKRIAQSFLSGMGLWSEDIDPELTKNHMLQDKDGVLVTAPSLAATQLFRIDLFQKNINNLTVYNQYYPFSTITLYILARTFDDSDVVEARFYHQKISSDNGVYSIKTAEEAFEDLKQGNAYISNYFGTSRSIKITDVNLGYYVGEAKQKYLMPVYVFQSYDNFFCICFCNPRRLFDDEQFTNRKV